MATFWTDAATEPFRNFRFKIQIAGSKFGDLTVYAKKCSKPSFTVQETSHKWLNHTFYYPGRTEWNTVTMSIVDTVDKKNGKNLMDAMALMGYDFPSDSNAYKTVSKAKAVSENGFGKVDIITLNAEGQPVETWTLTNAFIKDIKFGELDYESDDITQIDIELRYDFAKCTTA